MEEEKKDNKKAGMRRALNVRDILNKKYDVFPFEGKWKDAFDTPEVRGCWFVWGNSGNGKTSFVMQLCKELCKYDRVAFNSLEEGTSLTVQNNLRRFGMAEVSRHLAFIKEDIPTLKIRLRRHKSFNIVIIDSFQYTQMTYRDYIQLKEEFPDKLFVFISHARGKNPKGDAATSVMYDADLKIWVEGYVAFSKGRYQGATGEYTIWEKGAYDYWNVAGPRVLRTYHLYNEDGHLSQKALHESPSGYDRYRRYPVRLNRRLSSRSKFSDALSPLRLRSYQLPRFELRYLLNHSLCIPAWKGLSAKSVPPVHLLHNQQFHT